MLSIIVFFFFFKQKTAYEMRISDWSSDVCSSDLRDCGAAAGSQCRASSEAARRNGTSVCRCARGHRGNGPADGAHHLHAGSSEIRISRRAGTAWLDTATLDSGTGVDPSAQTDRKRTRLNSRHSCELRMLSPAWTKKLRRQHQLVR